MRLQRMLAQLDEAICSRLDLESWGDGDMLGKHCHVYFVGVGPSIGIMGIDGRIHTVMGYFSVRHYYDGSELLRRIPVRKDLKIGERLVTEEEILQHQYHHGGLSPKLFRRGSRTTV
jgi:hypothetical protein